MKDLINTYNIWQQDSANKDMRRMFDRSVTPQKAMELIQRIKDLEEAFMFIKSECDGVHAGNTYPPINHYEPVIINVKKVAEQALKKAV